MTERVRFDLAYDGTLFHGWAAQPGLRTVQSELEDALALVFRGTIPLTVAGRTDAGVHAAHQVAAADLPSDSPLLSNLPRLTRRLNVLLASAYAAHCRLLAPRGDLSRALAPRGASDLVIQQLSIVSENFDARFSAEARHYRYLLVDRPESMLPTRRFEQWWVPSGELDEERMNSAASLLVGIHDFLSFCRPRDGATTIRNLRRLEVTRDGGPVRIDVSADAFCHSMVRSLVGALVEVGRGNRDEQWVASLVQNPARSHGVPVAPAAGLTLVGVDYPPKEQWDARNAAARQQRSAEEIGDCGC